MNQIRLSHVITTFNKKQYLQVVLSDLIRARKFDEEIIVIDGGSNDGTADYLEELLGLGKIQMYLSERDFGEGHGFNKGLLAAQGELIKLLTDDDIYDFSVVGTCRNFMETHPNIDYVNTHGGWYDLDVDNEIYVFTEIYLGMMSRWMTEGTPFACCTLGMMIRRSSLPFLGLFNPSIKRADAEYSLRITSQKIKMAWFTGVGYVRLLNESSNSSAFAERIQDETSRLNSFYKVEIDGPRKTEQKQFKFAQLFEKVRNSLRPKFPTAALKVTKNSKYEFDAAAVKARVWLLKINETIDQQFYSN